MSHPQDVLTFDIASVSHDSGVLFKLLQSCCHCSFLVPAVANTHIKGLNGFRQEKRSLSKHPLATTHKSDSAVLNYYLKTRENVEEEQISHLSSKRSLQTQEKTVE